MAAEAVQIQWAGDTRKKLSKLLKSAHPNMDNESFARLELSYWRRVCVNPDRHAKKYINPDNYEMSRSIMLSSN